MTEHFADRLSRLIDERGPICAGLDPRKNQMPKDTTEIAWAREVIRVLRDKVAAFKPQIAFWQDDWSMLATLQDFDGSYGDAICIADCKRGDIGSTAKAYADNIFEHTWVDAITLNPYLGEDSLQPFVDAAEEQDRGLFVLVRTSNPGANDLQTVGKGHLALIGAGGNNATSVSDRVAYMIHALGERLPKSQSGRTRVGAVIGLTVEPKVIAHLRKLMPDSIFLMPGYGAQGGNPECFNAALDERGGGVLVSASRSLTLPWTVVSGISSGSTECPSEWKRRIEIECKLMKAELEQTV